MKNSIATFEPVAWGPGAGEENRHNRPALIPSFPAINLLIDATFARGEIPRPHEIIRALRRSFAGVTGSVCVITVASMSKQQRFIAYRLWN